MRKSQIIKTKDKKNTHASGGTGGEAQIIDGNWNFGNYETKTYQPRWIQKQSYFLDKARKIAVLHCSNDLTIFAEEIQDIIGCFDPLGEEKQFLKIKNLTMT